MAPKESHKIVTTAAATMTSGGKPEKIAGSLLEGYTIQRNVPPYWHSKQKEETMAAAPLRKGQERQVSFRFCEYEQEPVGGESHPPKDLARSSAAVVYHAQLLSTNQTNNPSTTSTAAAATTTTTSNTWNIQKGSKTATTTTTTHTVSIRNLLATPVNVAKELFLPIGFPHSVRDGYLEYQLYDSCQGLCSYLRGVLCSAQVLQAAGVGDETATAWGAAMAWAFKDGLGMMGGLVFSYVASPLFDAHVKEFRLFADVINDVALTLDMLTPYCYHHGRRRSSRQSYLVLVSSISTLCKTLCGMSAAATKANITVYFAHTHGNMADLNAKEATQETLVSLVGMLCGVTLAKWIGQYEKSHATWAEQVQWTVFIVLTAIHVWANWKGVCLLRLTSLNRERAELVLLPVCQQIIHRTNNSSSSSSSSSIDKNDVLKIQSPSDINESLLISASKMFYAGSLQLNSRLVQMMTIDRRKDKNGPSLPYLQWFWQGHKKYVLTLDTGGVVRMCLLRHATNTDELQAFCHALAVRQHVRDRTNNRPTTAADCEQVVLEMGKRLERWFPKQGSHDNTSLPAQLATAGWDVDGRLYLGFSRRRTEFILKQD